jgi:hypothetical protein
MMMMGSPKKQINIGMAIRLMELGISLQEMRAQEWHVTIAQHNSLLL